MYVYYFYSNYDGGCYIFHPSTTFSEFVNYYPSECLMMIPGTYAEMHKDYD